MMSDLLLTFYGDDFTGSTDAMEGLALNGVPTALFLEPPTAAQLQGRFADLRAVGVAGVSRSLSPDAMTDELRPALAALKALAAPLTHYKVCSTFDSSPLVGSIGRATDIGWEVFKPPVVPLVVGAPSLRRYVAFGNLFATVDETTYRLDRHPTMRHHPITPMHESDLRLHLAQQTDKNIDLLDVRHLAGDTATIDRHFRALVDDGAEVILFDTLDEAHLLTIGRLLWSLRDEGPLFVVGSSGVEYALTAYWHAAGVVEKPPLPGSAGPVDQIVVMSGSASPVSAAQIDWAREHGFHALRLDSAALVNPDRVGHEREAVVAAALRVLASGQSLVLYSAQGPDDPAIAATRDQLESLGLDPNSAGQRLATQQGLILREVLARYPVIRRVCVAGGDTCSHATRQLDIYALEMVAPLAPGGPLCRASAHTPRFDGLEIVLKGGQVGAADYYGLILQGGV